MDDHKRRVLNSGGRGSTQKAYTHRRWFLLLVIGLMGISIHVLELFPMGEVALAPTEDESSHSARKADKPSPKVVSDSSFRERSGPDSVPSELTSATPKPKGMKLPEGQATALIKAANTEGDWEAFMAGVEDGTIEKDYRGRRGYPILMSMVLTQAPLPVVRKLTRLGVPLHPNHLNAAVASGDPEKLNFLLSYGLHPSNKDDGGTNLMKLAASSNNIRLIKLVANISPGWREKEPKEPSLFDHHLGHDVDPEVLQFLLNEGIGPTERTWNSKRSKKIPKEIIATMRRRGMIGKQGKDRF